MKIQNESRKKKFLEYLPLIIVFGFCISITSASVKSIRSIIKTQKLAQDRVNAIEELKRENEILKNKIEIEQSQEFIEKEIRNKLDYSKEGEIVLILPPDEELERYKPKIIQNEAVNTPNWKKWAWMFDINI